MPENVLTYTISVKDEGSKSVEKFGSNARSEMEKIEAKKNRANAARGARVDENWEQAGFSRHLAEEKAIVEARRKAERDAERALVAQRISDEKAVAEARRKHERQEREAEKAERKAEHEGGLHGTLAGLNESFGRRSNLGHLAHLAEGGGALMGLTLVTHGMREIGDEAVRIKKEVREGKIDQSEAVIEVAKQVPVLGSIFSLGESINELLTGEKHNRETIREVIKETREESEQWAEREIRYAEQQRHVWDQVETSIRSAVQARALLDTPEGRRGVVAAEQHRANVEPDAKAALDKAMEKADTEYRVGVKEIHDKRFALHEKLKGVSGEEASNQAHKAFAKLAAEEKALKQHRLDERRKAQDEMGDLQDAQSKAADAGVGEAQKKQAEARQQSDDAFAEIVHRGQEHVAEVQHESHERTLRLQGKDYEAELEQIRAAAEARRREAGHAAAEQLRSIAKEAREGKIDYLTAGVRAGKLALGLAAGQGAADTAQSAAETEARQKDAIATRQKRIAVINDEIAARNHLHESEKAQLELENNFAQRHLGQAELSAASQARRQKMNDESRKGILQEQAEAGSVQASIELKKLDVQKRFQEQRQRLAGQLGQGPAADKAIQGQIAALADAERVAMLKADHPFPAIPMLAQRHNGAGRLSGAGMRAREQAFLDKPELHIKLPPEMAAGAKAAEKTAAFTEAMSQALVKLVTFFSTGGGASLESVFNTR